jgi:hypothetical protein
MIHTFHCLKPAPRIMLASIGPKAFIVDMMMVLIATENWPGETGYFHRELLGGNAGSVLSENQQIENFHEGLPATAERRRRPPAFAGAKIE